MAMSARGVLGRLGYGVLFCLVLPVLLGWWAGQLQVELQGLRWPVTGSALVAVAAAWTGWAMATLMVRGEGLPMNAFPPKRLVESGPYALAPHPIYVGFVALCAGVALVTGSGAGLLVVTPLAALGCAALVWGYERDDLVKRFGRLPRAWVGLPAAGDGTPTWGEAWGAVLLVFPLWLLCYEAIFLVGMPADAFDVKLAGERGWPVIGWTEVVYASAYVGVPLAVLLAPTRRALRRFGVQGLLAIGGITVVYLCVPIVSPMKPHGETGWLGLMMDVERAMSVPPVAAFPSFHAVWACLAAEAVGQRGRGWAVAAWAWAMAVCASCVTTGMHALPDVAAALVAALALRHYDGVYAAILRGTEWLANTWRSWRVGQLRIINHGVYPGIGAAAGVGGMAFLSGETGWTVGAALTGMVCAALWAQVIEGSPSLLRPFGYYGFLIGSLLAVAACGAAGGPAAKLLAAGAVMAPWVQAIGRLRCLVQGCCHGRPVEARFGIRVTEGHSRVTKAGMGGVSIHPTPLYSILGNLVIGCLLLRLWWVGAALPFIGGMYLILGGMARFVEETYRGEPQTKMWGKLAMYHWLAIGSVGLGMAAMCAQGERAVAPIGWPGIGTAGVAAGCGAVFWFAMGIDFPNSGRRFARLSG